MSPRSRWPSPLTPRRRRALASEVDEELRAHLALRAADNEREGMDPEDALVDAHNRFGDLDLIRAACLDAEEDHPLRLAGRVATRIGLLAVGFGAVALAFALVQSVLLQPLRFADADRLVRFGEGWDDAQIQASTFVAWRYQSSAFDDLIAFGAREYTLTGNDLPIRIRAMRIGERYFDVFGVDPVLGRTFLPDEVETTPRPVVLLSEALWETRFRRSTSVLGRTLDLNGQPHTVIGVIPVQGQLSHVVDVWTPLAFNPADTHAMVYTIGRLRDGVDLEAARADITAITERLAVSDPEASRSYFTPLHDLYATPVRPTILLLLVVSALILVLVWAAVFRRSFDRSPMGRVSGTNTSSQAWMEASAVVAVAALLGGGLAVGVHRLTYDALFERWGPLFAPPGLAVVAVMVVLAVATVVGLVGAHRMASWEVRRRPWRRWAEQALVVGATAATVVLLVVAVQEHGSEPRPTPGLDDRGLYVADLVLSGEMTVDQANDRMGKVLGKVREVPGVDAASIGWAFPFHREERLLRHEVILGSGASARRIISALELVGAGYVETVQASLIEGRDAAPWTPDAPAREAVVSAAFAAQAWPGQRAIGRHIDIDADGMIRTVVGVLDDIPYATLEPDMPVVYIPYTEFGLAQATLVIRATGPDVPDLSGAVRRAAYRADSQGAVQPLTAVAEMRAEAGRATTTRLRLLAGMSGIGLACVLLGVIQLMMDRVRDQVLWGKASDDVSWGGALASVVLGLGIGVAVVVVATHELVWLGDVDLLTVMGAAVGTGLVLVATTWIAAWQALRSV